MTNPMTPADCDLQDFSYIPVDVQRLLKSETWVLSTGEEKAAAMCLWLESWHQLPAASLPDNDRMLAHLAQVPPTRWKKVKDMAMRGWELCADGRWYHPVVAEKALEAWIEKLINRISGAAGNAKRWDLAIDTQPMEQSLRQSVAMLQTIAPVSPSLKKKAVLTLLKSSHIDAKAIAPRPNNASPPDSGCDRKGEGEGKGSINKDSITCCLSESADSAGPDPAPENLENPPPDTGGRRPAGGLSDCPHGRILELYAKHLPHLTQHRSWEGARREKLRCRWQQAAKPSAYSPEGYASEAAGLQWWDDFLGYIATETRLAAGFERDDGSVWRPDLDWICTAGNFQKIIDGKYDK